MKLFCDKCGYIDVAHHDGYGFGDRALEGVMFEVKVEGTKLVTSEVESSSRDYFSDLNRDKWIKAANKSLEDVLDEAGEGLTCPAEGNDVIILNDDGSDYTPPASPKKAFKGPTVRVFKGVTTLEDYLKDQEPL